MENIDYINIMLPVLANIPKNTILLHLSSEGHLTEFIIGINPTIDYDIEVKETYTRMVTFEISVDGLKNTFDLYINKNLSPNQIIEKYIYIIKYLVTETIIKEKGIDYLKNYEQNYRKTILDKVSISLKSSYLKAKTLLKK